ncbi:MAG: hypothetical protein H0W89_07085 [Candidatus Levybacteria bacterium]|nr:hypothetical protein [Candidatus Levybacteria bacterium]
MKTKNIPYLVDPSLTPQNADEKGYRYVTDAIDPYEAVKDLIGLAEREGYIFGVSKKETDSKFKIGLYHKKK